MKICLKYLLLVIVLAGCKTKKIQVEKIEQIKIEDFCQITNQLLERLNHDEKFKKYFYLENKPLNTYLDTIIG